MTEKEIDLIRDSAINLEKSNLKMACELMELALKYRPNGAIIKKKVNIYKERLKPEKNLKEIFDSGELVIIPAGFRCYTKINLFKSLGIKQASLPFDSGFFSPHSVASVLKNKKISLTSSTKSHNVCIKLENKNDSTLGKEIKFESSSYDKINSLVADKKNKHINRYLDITCGFYTLDIKNKFVLAHYNWHPLSNKQNNKNTFDIASNMKNINDIINNRINRMFEMCDKAKYVVFAFGEYQGYQYMSINEEAFDLNDFSYLQRVLNERFGDKCIVLNISEINTADKLLKKIGISSD